jgi:cytochrome b pre-mRNA-processing protein 3
MSGSDVSKRIAQYLFDTMITDMDRSLREMGIGDLSVGKKVKAMAEAYYGRSQAYDAALEADEVQLADAIRRNVFGTLGTDRNLQVSIVTGMVRYIRLTIGNLENQSIDALTEGQIQFAEYT